MESMRWGIKRIQLHGNKIFTCVHQQKSTGARMYTDFTLFLNEWISVTEFLVWKWNAKWQRLDSMTVCDSWACDELNANSADDK